MLKRISKTFLGFACILSLGVVSCRTLQPSTNGLIEIQQNTVANLPKTEISLPYLTPFEFILPTLPLLESKCPSKSITLDFTYRDKNHVKSQDPMLFADNDMEIINLQLLKENNYAFPLPGSKVISPYAGRRKNHSGIDLKTCANDTIVAAFDGVVRMSQSYAAYGNVIVIRHYNGLETVYSHNSKNIIKPGEVILAGHPIALTGRTGRATTEHLHFETRINGQHFNPELIFDFDTHELQEKSLLCIKEGNTIKIKTLDPLPFNLVAR